MNNTLIVNLYAGPGCGKSTTMAGVFYTLKCLGVNCEMGHEFAKEKVWEESYAVLQDQVYVFAKQLHTLRRLIGKVDVIITDSPITLSLIYGKNESQTFRNFVIDTNSQLWNINFFLRRRKKFNPIGRLQTLEQSIEKDNEIESFLKENYIAYESIDADRTAVDKIVNRIRIITGVK